LADLGSMSDMAIYRQFAHTTTLKQLSQVRRP
jgi:hypothetical protein